MSLTDDAVDAFVGRGVKEVLRVVVRFDDETSVLHNTAVLRVNDEWVQVIADPQEPRVRRMTGPNDVEFQGDWDDRTGVEFSPWTGLSLPATIAHVYGVWDISGAEKHGHDEYLLGLLFAGPDKAFIMGMVLGVDDLELGSAELLWNYIGAVLPNIRSVAIRAYGPTDGGTRQLEPRALASGEERGRGA